MTVVDVVKKTYVDAQDKKLGFPIVIDNADRAVQFPIPVLNQRVYNISTGDIEQWNGTLWIAEFEGVGGTKTRWNTKAAGLVADGVINEYVKFNALVNATMQPAGGTVEVVGVIVIGTNMSIPSNVTLRFINGAYLSPLGGINITFNGKMVGDTRRRFGGAGTITFGRVSTRFRPEWWGVVGDGVAADQIPFENCARDVCATAVAVNSGVTVAMGANATYSLTDTINTTQHRVHWEGAKKYSTQVIFNPATAKPCFKFQNANAALVLYQCSITNVSFTGQGAQQKIAIDLYDQSETRIEGCTTNAWTGNSGSALTPSIALRTKGREWLTVHDVDFYADRPIHITRNTNAPVLSADHFTFSKCLLGPQVAAEWCILIDADAGISNLTVDQQAWVGGKGGLYYVAGAAPSTALSCHISNVRYEQAADFTGYAVRWEGPVNELLLTNVYGGGLPAPTNGGFYFRNAGNVTLTNCNYSGTGGAVALDIDSTCDYINLFNTNAAAGSVANLGTMVEVLSATKRASGAPFAPFTLWANPATNPMVIKIGGVMKFCYKAQIASGGTLTLGAVHTGNGLKTASLVVSGYSAVGPLDEGGTAMVTPTGPKALGGSANFAAGNVGGKLCVFANNPSQILNNMPQAMYVTVDATISYG